MYACMLGINVTCSRKMCIAKRLKYFLASDLTHLPICWNVWVNMHARGDGPGHLSAFSTEWQTSWNQVPEAGKGFWTQGGRHGTELATRRREPHYAQKSFVICSTWMVNIKFFKFRETDHCKFEENFKNLQKFRENPTNITPARVAKPLHNKHAGRAFHTKICSFPKKMPNN